MADGMSGGTEQEALTPAWRQLAFYDANPIRDASDFARPPSVFRSSAASTTAVTVVNTRPAFLTTSDGKEQGSSNLTVPGSPSSSYVLVGQSNGRVVVCETEHYATLGSWTAFHGVRSDSGSSSLTGRLTHIACDTVGRIVTLGEDEGARFPILRVWDLRSAVKSNDGQLCPRLLAETKVQHGSNPFPVASMANTTTFSFLAVGLGDGTVLLLRGFSNALEQAPRVTDATNNALPAVTLPKFKVIHQPSSRPGEADFMDTVTGLGFAEETIKAQSNVESASSKARGPTSRKTRNRIADISYAADADLTSANGAAVGKTNGPTVQLFIVTLTRVLRYTVLGKGAGTSAAMIDDVGGALNCSVVLSDENDRSEVGEASSSKIAGKMIIAREEAIYVIGVEGREMSLAYEGKKAAIRLCSTQLIIISPPMAASAASDSATVRHFVSERGRKSTSGGRDGSPRSNEVAKVTVFDLESKLVAYTGTFEGGVRDAWSDSDGAVCVLCDDGALTRLDEKTLRQKLDILFRKSLYLLAISVARSHTKRSKSTISSDAKNSVDPILGDIHRKYGDYLYDKGDYEGAINQFVKTIGVTQPSYVIRKFLDAQRITNLTVYLQELHACGLANADHTTLLLNCFAKLKDVASLDKFIKRPIEKTGKQSDRFADMNGDSLGEQEEDEDDIGNQDDLPFDLDTAIRVCRQGGYFQHAAFLAQRYHQTDEFVRIQIEDLNDQKAATQYIRSLSIEDAQRNLVRFGRKMLEQDPDSTTDLLIEFCSGTFEPIPTLVGNGVNAHKAEKKSNNYLHYLQVGNLRKGTQDSQSEHIPISNGNSNGIAIEAPVPTTNDTQALAIPSPQIFFSHFIDHREQFVRFLETVALARWDQAIQTNSSVETIPLPPVTSIDDEADEFVKQQDEGEQKIVWNTLLELYLSLGAEGQRRESGYPRRALLLLQQFTIIPYDVLQALIVCSKSKFTEGVVLLKERLGLYEDIIRMYMERDHDDSGDDEDRQQTDAARTTSQTILQALERYGESEPDLYALVLRHLVASKARLERHQSDVERILTHIFDERLLSPLEIVQLLSKRGVASIGLLREHLMRALEAQQSDIATNASLTQTYREETKAKEGEIDALRDLNQPRIFQQSKCSACGGQLDLPSVHFMCRHSYHSRCLGEGENECPLCAQSHGVLLEIRRNNVQFGQCHDLFLNEVEDAEDGFDVVANMFSKGLFGPQQLGEER